MTDGVCEIMVSRDLDKILSILRTGEFKGLGVDDVWLDRIVEINISLGSLIWDYCTVRFPFFLRLKVHL